MNSVDWLSVNDSLPEPGERVLVTDGAAVFEMYRVKSGKWFRPGFYEVPGFIVTAWAKMPDAPGKNDEDA